MRYTAPKRSTDLLATKNHPKLHHILVLLSEHFTIFRCNSPLIIVKLRTNFCSQQISTSFWCNIGQKFLECIIIIIEEWNWLKFNHICLYYTGEERAITHKFLHTISKIFYLGGRLLIKIQLLGTVTNISRMSHSTWNIGSDSFFHILISSDYCNLFLLYCRNCCLFERNINRNILLHFCVESPFNFS